MSTVSRELIADFLAQKRVALVGASRTERSYSRSLLREFRKRGYDVIPVNPSTTEIDGQPCFSRVQYVKPSVEAALILTPIATTERIIHDCAEAGVKRIWVRGVDGKQSLSQAAVKTCCDQDIHLIDGYCPLMFLPQTHFLHRLHGFVLKLAGKYPAT
jgi:predicted CoA-binding protein